MKDELHPRIRALMDAQKKGGTPPDLLCRALWERNRRYLAGK